MTPADLLALAERCEQAAGADRELDEAIRDAMPEDWLPPLRMHFASAPEFTASLDAAMSVYLSVPERVPSDPRKALVEALRQRAGEA